MNPGQPIVTVIPSRPILAAGQESTVDFLIRIDAPQLGQRRERRPLNLGIVLDRSGSMRGGKLHHAKDAVAFAVRNMRPDDRVSLTIYDDQVQTLVPSAPVSHAGPQILALLPKVHDGGSTALHDAWVQGGLQVSEHQEPGRLNRVLLVSDGLANVGETSTEVLVSRARELFARGISTSTVGVGGDFNEDLMIPMARDGGGSGWFVESPADFTRIFGGELADLAAVFGEKARLRLEPRGGRVEILEVLNDFSIERPPTDPGGSPRPGGSPAAARPAGPGAYVLGTLLAGSPLEIVARVKVQGGELRQPIDLFDVRLSWEVPGDGQAELQTLVRLMDAGQIGAMQALLKEQVAHWGEVYAATGDTEAALERDELSALASVAERADKDASSFRLARKQSSYQAYSRSLRSRRQEPKP